MRDDIRLGNGSVNIVVQRRRVRSCLATGLLTRHRAEINKYLK